MNKTTLETLTYAYQQAKADLAKAWEEIDRNEQLMGRLSKRRNEAEVQVKELADAIASFVGHAHVQGLDRKIEEARREHDAKRVQNTASASVGVQPRC